MAGGLADRSRIGGHAAFSPTRLLAAYRGSPGVYPLASQFGLDGLCRWSPRGGCVPVFAGVDRSDWADYLSSKVTAFAGGGACMVTLALRRLLVARLTLLTQADFAHGRFAFSEYRSYVTDLADERGLKIVCRKI